MKPDWSKIFGRAIIVCWTVILSCWFISLFKPEWFIIVVENERVINAGRWIENNMVAKSVVALILSVSLGLLHLSL